MSNLDTTLREKFKSSQFAGGKYADLPEDEADEICAFFLSEFHQLMIEKREAIEALKPPKEFAMKQSDYEKLGTLDDVLSILRD